MVSTSVGHGYGLPGGYAGRGTVGTDKDTYFCTHHLTHTPTCHTHTHAVGLSPENHVGFKF